MAPILSHSGGCVNTYFHIYESFLQSQSTMPYFRNLHAIFAKECRKTALWGTRAGTEVQK